MKNRREWKWPLVGFLVLLSAMTLARCAERPPPATVADTAERHVANGMSLLDSGNLDGAEGEFDRALTLDSQWGPAFVGRGLVFGTQANGSSDGREKARLARRAFDALRKGKKYATNDEQKVEAYVAFIRVHRMIKEQGWLEDAEENLRYAIVIDGRAPAPYLAMAEAYQEAYRFSEAARFYRKVVEINSDYRAEAGRSLELMERIQRAAPVTTIGKQLALKEAITRGETAALFMQELRLAEVYAAPGRRNSGLLRKPTDSGDQRESPEKPPAAADIENHPSRQDVDAVVRLKVRGLELYPDQTFRPNERVTRAAFASMMEDILVKATGEASLASRFTGTPSPFIDLRNDLPYFDAVMVCTGLGIMKPLGSLGREFRPMENISGVEALLAIRSLKEYLKTG